MYIIQREYGNWPVVAASSPHTHYQSYTVVPLMKDHTSHLKKRSLKRYLVGNQEVTPKALVPDYPPNTENLF